MIGYINIWYYNIFQYYIYIYVKFQRHNLCNVGSWNFGSPQVRLNPRVQEVLEDPKNFTIVILGLVVFYSITADIFDLYPTPVWITAVRRFQEVAPGKTGPTRRGTAEVCRLRKRKENFGWDGWGFKRDIYIYVIICIYIYIWTKLQ